MKLLCLNIWGGQVYEPLIEFIKQQSKTIDIFCFQEMLNGKPGEKSEVLTNAPKAKIDLYSDFLSILNDYNGYFAPSQGKEGLSMFVKKTIEVASVGDAFVYLHKNSMQKGRPETIGRNIQYLNLIYNNRNFSIINFHGLWAKSGKGDTPERLKQSENIVDIVKNLSGSKMLCGDFNLWPDTKSIEIIENNFKNLIKEYNVKLTRSRLYPDYLDEKDRFADYVFVSSDINVLDFKVLENEVSDHLPMILEFNL